MDNMLCSCEPAGNVPTLAFPTNILDTQTLHQVRDVSFDGIMKLPHLGTAGTSCKWEPLIKTGRIIDDKATQEFVQKQPNSYTKRDANCCNFKADVVLARHAKKYDITGVGGAFCRHAFLLLLLNFPTGERYIYAVFVIYNLLVLHKIGPLFFWYDVNCRFKQHFM